MKNQGFYFEIRDLLTQFINAFDNIVIKRYDGSRNTLSKLQVRYVYSPKQRVVYDLVNTAQNITLPVISVSITSVKRAEDRVYNKISGFYYNQSTSVQYKQNSVHVRTPVPVDIDVSMSILAKYQTDIDQILSNFIPYSNPYIIISWKVPAEFSLSDDYEIRSEVMWSGNVSLAYPTELAASAKYIVSGDTTFTIKGWLFPAVDNASANIITIDANFRASSNVTTYQDLSGNTYSYPTSAHLYPDMETLLLSGNTSTGYISSFMLSSYALPVTPTVPLVT